MGIRTGPWSSKVGGGFHGNSILKLHRKGLRNMIEFKLLTWPPDFINLSIWSIVWGMCWTNKSDPHKVDIHNTRHVVLMLYPIGVYVFAHIYKHPHICMYTHSIYCILFRWGSNETHNQVSAMQCCNVLNTFYALCAECHLSLYSILIPQICFCKESHDCIRTYVATTCRHV